MTSGALCAGGDRLRPLRCDAEHVGDRDVRRTFTTRLDDELRELAARLAVLGHGLLEASPRDRRLQACSVRSSLRTRQAPQCARLPVVLHAESIANTFAYRVDKRIGMVFTCGMPTKEIKRLVRDLEQQGWRVELRKGGHYVAYAPDGVGIVTFSGTPSDHRAYRNTLAQLRRAGYKE